MKKIKITNVAQFQKLVEELEKNPSLARGFRRGAVLNDFREQWNRITTALNSLGPPVRTSDGWQKIWRDLIVKVKKKMVMNKAESRATGGGMYKQVVLSPLEEAVSNLLQFHKRLSPKGMCQGVPNIDPELLQYATLQKSVEIEIAPITRSEANNAPTTSAQPCVGISQKLVKQKNGKKGHLDFLEKHSIKHTRTNTSFQFNFV